MTPILLCISSLFYWTWFKNIKDSKSMNEIRPILNHGVSNIMKSPYNSSITISLGSDLFHSLVNISESNTNKEYTQSK